VAAKQQQQATNCCTLQMQTHPICMAVLLT
jgi:hypothetical protein